MRRGETWFVGKDVAEALGYSNTRDALSKHVDDEDKTTVAIRDTGSNYKSQAIFINESGLYSLILSSKLPQAKVFKHWVTSEVLPAIRKTGGFIPTKDADGRPHLHRDSEGNVYTEMYLVWTEEGREFIHRLIETAPETQSQEELIQLELAFSA